MTDRLNLLRSYPKNDVCAFRFTNAEWGLFSNFAALAARLGRTAPPLTPTWHRDRVDVMRWVLRRKRETLPDRIDALLRRTESRPIVEFSTRDDYWGAHADAARYVGANVFGRLWMELRHHAATGHPNLASAAYADPGRLGALAR